jgi:SEC-C motif-containing protein
MRSRYAAFARDEVAYLLTSWHPSTRPATLAATGGLRWRRLEVLATSGGGLLDTEGTVEFRAWFDGPAGRGSQHEVSRFVRGADGWQYLDEVPPASGRGPV